MKSKEELIELGKEFYTGNYNTQADCDEFFTELQIGMLLYCRQTNQRFIPVVSAPVMYWLLDRIEKLENPEIPFVSMSAPEIAKLCGQSYIDAESKEFRRDNYYPPVGTAYIVEVGGTLEEDILAALKKGEEAELTDMAEDLYAKESSASGYDE